MEIEMSEILTKAKNLADEKKQWHFHMLGKNCCFNKHKGKFSIVFEDEENGEVVFALFEEKPLKEAKELAGLMYGEEFLKKKEKDEHNPDFDAILKRAEELTEQGKEWHHHHLQPKCVFNEHKGKHCILFEDEENSKTLIAVYESKPMEDLVKIEKLFYKDIK